MKYKKVKYLGLFIVLSALLLGISSCRKEAFYKGNEPVLVFSADTLSFDTIFTQTATITRFLKIQNPTRTAILLKELKLMNLSGLGTFRINVDGESGTQFSNISIPAKDFIYVFVEATVDPQNTNNPFVILDEIQYTYNNVTQKSYLEAWGQDAYFHKGEIYRSQNITWQNDKPHVILSNDTFPGVGVDSFSTLTILPGCEIYASQGTGVFVDGELIIGQAGNQDSVVFRSNRIEKLPNGTDFEDKPGLWQGIALFSGAKTTMHNVCINQAIWGLQLRHYSEEITDMLVDAARPVAVLDKVQIKNSAQNALIAINADLTVRNSIFYNAGTNLVAIGLGGKVIFDNCTLYNSGVASSDAKESLVLSNVIETSQGVGVHPLEQADITNTIVYGSNAEQIVFSNDDLADFNYSFSHCAVKTTLQAQGGFTNCIFNQDPKFENSGDGDFHLKDNSPCIATGTDNGITEDIYFLPRTNFDIGAIAY